MLRAKVSKVLRSRPEWRMLGPALVASTSHNFQEDECLWDLAIPFWKNGRSSILNVLLLWSSEFMTSHDERVRSSLPDKKQDNEYYVIVLVDNRENPSGALCDFSSLQSGLLHLQSVPALLALSVEGILPTLHRYKQELEKRHENNPQPTPLLTPLLAHTTTSAPLQPLSQHDANILTDLCHSVRELEEATRTSSGRATLAEFLGPVVAKNIVDFWEDEWIA